MMKRHAIQPISRSNFSVHQISYSVSSCLVAFSLLCVLVLGPSKGHALGASTVATHTVATNTAAANIVVAKTAATLKQTIVVMGDSLSSGYGLKGASSWVDLLRHRLAELNDARAQSWSLVNASIAGETTSQAVRKIARVLKRERPRWVVIELGGNDALRGTDLRITQRNLGIMIDQVTATGAQVLLLGMRMPPNYGPAYSQKFASIFVEFGRQPQVLLVPFLLEAIAEDRGFFQEDQIHPNAKAQPLVFNTVWETWSSSFLDSL